MAINSIELYTTSNVQPKKVQSVFKNRKLASRSMLVDNRSEAHLAKSQLFNAILVVHGNPAHTTTMVRITTKVLSLFTEVVLEISKLR